MRSIEAVLFHVLNEEANKNMEPRSRSVVGYYSAVFFGSRSGDPYSHLFHLEKPAFWNSLCILEGKDGLKK